MVEKMWKILDNLKIKLEQTNPITSTKKEKCVTFIEHCYRCCHFFYTNVVFDFVFLSRQ